MHRWKKLALISLTSAAFAAGACKGKSSSSSEGKKGLTDAERSQLVECTKSLSAITDTDGDRRMMFLVEVCGKPLGFDAILEADASMKAKLMAEKTDYLCNEEAAKKAAEVAPKERNAVLIEGCGAEHYGLTKETAHHLSMSWFIGQRTAAWIADAIARAGDQDKDVVAALTLAMEKFDAPLPVPARVPGVYELPIGRPDMSYAMQALVVDAESTKLVERPRLKVTDKGADLSDPMVTAKPIELSEVRKNLRGEGGETPGDSAANVADNDAAKNGVNKPAAWAPLLVADKSLPAERVLAVVDGMRESGVHLGVAYGEEAFRAVIPFGVVHPDATPQPDLRAQLLLKDDGVEVWAGGEKREMAREADGRYPLEALQAELEAKGDLAGIAILISTSGSKATYQDLIGVLDMAKEAGFDLAITGPGGTSLASENATGVAANVEDTEAVIEGELDKEVIRTHMRKKLPRVQHCYEKELLVAPKLAGTVTVSFQISPEGSVQGAKAEGLGNANVESCIVAAVSSIQFPKPNKGGYVNVRYPYTLKPAP